MLRRAMVATAAVALLAVGCGGGGDGETVTVDVDGKTDQFTASFIDYFPKDVVARQGDTVDFKSIWTGEAHTVTMGTLVNQGLAEADALPPDSDEPPTLAKIPLFLPEGPGNANQAAAQPCFLATGDPPPEAACSEEQQEQPEFDGTQTYYNSGWLDENDVFKVKLADDIDPGVYRYFCNVHRTGQQGRITVVEEGGDAQTPDEVTDAGENQRNTIVEQNVPVYDTLKNGVLPPFQPTPEPAVVIAGGAAPLSTGLVNEFGPKELTVPSGSAVTWKVFGPHTISFNVPSDASEWLTRDSDGAVNINPKAVTPAGGPGGPGPAAPPGSVTDGGTFDGSGFRNSGLILSFPPTLSSFKLTFTKAGTYSYSCIVHPGMVGTVKVE